MNDKRRTLVIGVDGGGTKTAARVAAIEADGTITVLGEGYGGSSNVRAVGAAHAKANLEVAIDAAHAAADTANAAIDYAILALAGSSLPDVQAIIHDWAERRRLANKIDIVHDAEPVLTLGQRNGCGVALIVGTGSVAMGKNTAGEEAVIGGWGHWFGDQGSGFDLGRRALAAVADAVDGVAAQTTLIKDLTERLQVDHPRKIARQLGLAVDVRQEIAALAPIVIGAAKNGDAVATAIVDSAAAATAALVMATVNRLQLPSDVPLAIAGGIALSGEFFQDKLLSQLQSLGLTPRAVTIVADPVAGSLIMARDRLALVS